jgi:uncharacterized MnhB-related membrane protein
MTVERGIHFVMFILLLVGLCAVSAWASYTYIHLEGNDVALAVAGIALSWGVILSILYLGFRQLDWDWWS